MKNKREKQLPAQGCSDPPGPGDEGGTVPAPPSSSSSNGLPPVFQAGTGGARTTASKKKKRSFSSTLILYRVLEVLEGVEGELWEWKEDMKEQDRDWRKGLSDLSPDFMSGIASQMDLWWRRARWAREKIQGMDLRKETRSVGVDPFPTRLCVERGSSPIPCRRGKEEEPVQLPARGTCGPPNAGGEGRATEASNSSDRPPLPSPAGVECPFAMEEAQGQEGPTATATAERSKSPGGWTSSSSVGSMGGPTYSEVARRRRGEGRRNRGPEGPGEFLPRPRGITLRVPGVGDIGVAGLGDGDLIVTIPVPGVSPPKRKMSQEATRSPSPRREVRGKREFEGKRGWPGGGERSETDPPLPRCYRCLGRGHLARGCRGEDRSRRCYRCSADSCKWKECLSGVPKCPLARTWGLRTDIFWGREDAWESCPQKRGRGGGISAPPKLVPPHLVGGDVERK